MSRTNERVSRVRTRMGERRVLAEAVLVAAAIRLGLFVASFPTVRHAVETVSRPSGAVDDSVSVDRIGRSVTTAGRYVPRTTCLVEALTARTLLGRYGHPADLRIGVRREEEGGEHGRFGAHAWVESAGEIVVGGASRSEFVRLPPLDED